jgi:hypothetical protein
LRAVLLAVLQETLQAAEEETSKAPFYIASGLLVLYAALLSAVGTARHATFPPSRAVGTALMLVGAVLVAGVMATAVITG